MTTLLQVSVAGQNYDPSDKSSVNVTDLVDIGKIKTTDMLSVTILHDGRIAFYVDPTFGKRPTSQKPGNGKRTYFFLNRSGKNALRTSVRRSGKMFFEYGHSSELGTWAWVSKLPLSSLRQGPLRNVLSRASTSSDAATPTPAPTADPAPAPTPPISASASALEVASALVAARLQANGFVTIDGIKLSAA